MIQYLANIFSEQSDQARLVTTLIAAVIAVAVVLLNQWFNSKRARKDKIIEKIEETFSSMLLMQEAISSLHNEIITNYHKYPNEKSGVRRGAYMPTIADEYDNAHPIHQEALREGERLIMLSKLYFSDIASPIHKINQMYQEIYTGFTSSKDLGDYLSVYKEYKEEVDSEFEKLSSSLSKIMKIYMH